MPNANAFAYIYVVAVLAHVMKLNNGQMPRFVDNIVLLFRVSMLYIL